MRTGCLRAMGSSAALAALILLPCGCNSGSHGRKNTPGGPPAKLKLAQDNAYYVTGGLAFPRYYHVAVTLRDGRVLVLGGSDERGLNSIDRVEIYDQLAETAPEPQSGLGDFVDTDFQGDPIILPSGGRGGRLLFTATLLRTNEVLVLGGAPDLLVSEPIPEIDIFDPFTRTFRTLAAEWRIGQTNVARFGHTATLMPDGKVVIAGGQLTEVTTEVIQQPPPQPPIVRDVTTFPSVEELAVFDPAEEDEGVQELLDHTGRVVTLSVTRGRSGHAATRIAGSNGVLGTSDDLLVLAGGYGTLSGAFAPTTKIIGLAERDLVTPVEIYDPVQRVVFRAQVAATGRANTPYLVNLGLYNPRTIDGFLGAANVVLLTHGDDDMDEGGAFHTVPESEVFSAIFTGFGPGSGALLYEVDSPAGGHFQNIEDVRSGIASEFIGRSAAPALAVPRLLPTDRGERAATWVFTAGGVFLSDDHPLPGLMDGTVQATHLFDPFFNNNLLGAPRDLIRARTAQDPTGIVGTWLSADNEVPLTNSAVRWATAQSLLDLRRLPTPRVWHTASLVPGEDRIPGTRDDRVLVIGGGTHYIVSQGGVGGDPVFPSAVLFLPPYANGFF